MTGGSGGERDPEQLRLGLEKWLSAQWPAAREVEVTDYETFGSGGLSNLTIAFAAQRKEDGIARRDELVARLPPVGEHNVFQEYDLAKQARLQSALAAAGLPVPRVIGMEEDESWLGSPFYVMPRVRGMTPPDQPPYPFGGWVVELGETGQHALAVNTIEAVARVHALPWQELGLEFAARPWGTGLAAEMRWWDDYNRWSLADATPEDRDGCKRLNAWCAANMPATEPPSSLLWGDVRMGNMVYDDQCRVAAILDWEMMGIGPAEVDLGWHFAIRHAYVAALGLDSFPELPGFPSQADEIDRYEAVLGRPVQDLLWYTIYGAARISSCVVSVKRAGKDAGLGEMYAGPVVQPWIWKMIEEGK